LKSKWIGFGFALAVGLATLAIPPLRALPKPAPYVVAIAAFTVMLWVFQAMNNGVASILMMALMILAGIRVPLVLSGFASPQYWILLCVLFYGFAMQRTGLARRLAYYILSLFPATYRGILSAFFVIGLVLALGIPSMTVRTAIIVPIAWALVKSLELAPRSRGAALIMISAIEMAVIPGCAILYGSLNGPVVDSLFQSKQLALSWLGYAQVLAFPTLFLCGLLIVVNPLVLRPESRLEVSSTFAKRELQGLGAIKRDELITALVVLVSIAYWATDRIHHLPGFLIGMLGLAVFTMFGIVRDKDIGTGVSWTLLLFLGGIFSLANVVQDYKMTDLLTAFAVPVVKQLTFSPAAFFLVMAVAMLLLKFLDPSGFIALSVLFLPIVDVAAAAGIRPLLVIAPLLLASVPFWVSYQNIWIAMGEGITEGQGFSAGQRARLSNAYALVTAITLVIAVGYWKLIGVL
jgi:anion transporter